MRVVHVCLIFRRPLKNNKSNLGLFLGAHAKLASMARGRGRGRKQLAQGDFAVAEASRSVVIHGEEKEGEDVEDLEDDDEKRSSDPDLGSLEKGFDEKERMGVELDGTGVEIQGDHGSIDSKGVEGFHTGMVVKPWIALFADNRLKEEGSELRYVSPSVANGRRIVNFHSDELIQEEKLWKNAFLVYVYGLQPRLERFNVFAHARWKKYGVVSVSRVNADLFMVKFSSESGGEQMMKEGPFTFDNHPVVVKKWQPRFSFDTAICALPIWIQLPGLPWEFWSIDMLSKIGSVCGRPMYCDKCTLSKVKLGFARILVEMDSSGDFPDLIDLIDEQGNVFRQKVVYDWKPSVCSICRRFGHLGKDCKNNRQEKMVWRVKPVQQSGKSFVDISLKVNAQEKSDIFEVESGSAELVKCDVGQNVGKEVWRDIVKGKAVISKGNYGSSQLKKGDQVKSTSITSNTKVDLKNVVITGDKSYKKWGAQMSDAGQGDIQKNNNNFGILDGLGGRAGEPSLAGMNYGADGRKSRFANLPKHLKYDFILEH